jgi:hypothetical protein
MLLGGAPVDRISLARVLLASRSASALLTGLLASLVLTGTVQMWTIYLLRVGIGLCGAFAYPASTAVLPQIVIADQLQIANSIMNVGWFSLREIRAALSKPRRVLQSVALTITSPRRRRSPYIARATRAIATSSRDTDPRRYAPEFPVAMRQLFGHARHQTPWTAGSLNCCAAWARPGCEQHLENIDVPGGRAMFIEQGDQLVIDKGLSS